MKKIFISKDFLYKNYIIKRKSSVEIGIIMNCSSDTIRRNLKKYNILIRNNNDCQKGKILSEIHKQKISKKMSKEKHHSFGKKNLKFSEWNKKQNRKKENHPNFKGKVKIGGYIYIFSPNHPNKTKSNYILEHRYIIEQKINRYLLSTEVVHHKNEIKIDNRLENLELMDKIKHGKLHAKQQWERQKCQNIK